MAAAIQCVFLLDDSAFCIPGDVQNGGSCGRLRLTILRVLCYLSSSRAKSLSCVRWSYKFIDIEGISPSPPEKQSLCDFSLENFENLEAEILARSERRNVIKSLKRTILGTSTSPKEVGKSPTEILGLAFHELYADYVWDIPDISSPIKTVNYSNKTEPQQHENYIIVLAPYSAFTSRITRSNPFKSLLPKSLFHTLSNLVKLLWIDTDTTGSAKKVDGLLPLDLLTKDVSSCEINSVLPLSPVMNIFLKPKPKRITEAEKPVCTTLTIFHETKMLFCLSVSSLWKSCHFNREFRKGHVLGMIPVSWLSETRYFIETCMTGVVVQSSGTSAMCFNKLLHRLRSDFTLLLLELSSDDPDCCVPKQLCVLQHFETNLCLLTSLSSELTLQHLVALNNKSFRKQQGLHFVPPLLERWAVPSSKVSFPEQKRSVNRLSQDKYSARSIKLFHQSLSSLLSNSHKQRKKLATPCGKTKAFSDHDLKTHRKTSVRQHNSVNLPCLTSESNVDGTNVLSSCERISSLTAEVLSARPVGLERNISEDIGKDNSLNGLYQEAVEGTMHLEGAAERITASLDSLANSNALSINELAVREGLLLTAKAVGAKHEAAGNPRGFEHQRELQLQAFLQLEIQKNLHNKDKIPSDINNVENECIQQVVVLLRTFSFLAGALELNRFLRNSLKYRYGGKLNDLMNKVGEELNIPLSSDSDTDSSASEGDDESSTVGEPPGSISSLCSSSISNLGFPNKKCKKPFGRTVSMISTGSTKRQIRVPRTLLNSSSSTSFSVASDENSNKNIKRSSSKKKKLSSPDDKYQKPRRSCRRNIFEKLNQSFHTMLGKSKSGLPQKQVKSPKRHSQRSPNKHQQGNFSDAIDDASNLSSTCLRQISQSPKRPHPSSPRTPKNKFKLVTSGFTPNEKFPELTNTPEPPRHNTPHTHKTPQRATRSAQKSPCVADLLKGSPASCTRSKCGSSPSPSKTPTSSRTLSRSRKLRTQSSSCIRKLSLDSPCKAETRVSPRTPIKTSGSFRKEAVFSPSRNAGEVESFNFLLDENDQFLDSLPGSPGTSSANQIPKISPLKSCLKQTRVNEVEESSGLLFMEVQKCHKLRNCRSNDFCDTPKKKCQEVSFNDSPSLKRSCQTSNACSENVDFVNMCREDGRKETLERTSHHVLCPFNKMDSENNMIEKPCICLNVPLSLHNTKSIRYFEHKIDESFTESARNDGLTVHQKSPAYDLPEYSKVPSTLSMRWPQKKRKLSPINKKYSSSSEIGCERQSCVEQLISPPSKKTIFNKRYTSPSTISIMHLTTSPVVRSGKP